MRGHDEGQPVSDLHEADLKPRDLLGVALRQEADHSLDVRGREHGVHQYVDKDGVVGPALVVTA